jgi:hypothetical protein
MSRIHARTQRVDADKSLEPVSGLHPDGTIEKALGAPY